MRKLYLFFAVLCSLLGAQTANADVYLPGAMNSWDITNSNYKFTNTGTNIYQLKVTMGSSAQEFKIYDGSTWYGASVTFNASTKYKALETPGSNCTMGFTSQDVRVVYNQSSHALAVSPLACYLVGYVTSESGTAYDWSTNKGLQLTETEDNIFTGTVVLGAGSSKNFCVAVGLTSASGDWTTFNSGLRFGASSASTTIGTQKSITQGEYGLYVSTAGTYNITVNLNTQKVLIEEAETVTETGRTLEALALHKSGGSDAGTFTKVSDTEWTLGETQIEVGKSNSYYLTATYTVAWNNGEETTETVDYVTGSSSTNAASTATAYSLQERNSNYFYFNYSNYMTTTGTVTVSEEVPTAVTFTEVESEYVVVPNDPVITLCNASGTVIGTFTKVSDTEYTLGKTSIGIGNSYTYKIGFQASASDDVTYYAIKTDGYWIGQTTYNIVNNSYTFTFGSSTSDSSTAFTNTTVTGTVTLSDDVPATMSFTQFDSSATLDKAEWNISVADGPAVFLVGDYLNNWRPTPEYQMTKNADGVYELTNFVIYPDTEFKIRVYTSSTSYVDYSSTGSGTYWINSWKTDAFSYTGLSTSGINYDWKLGQTMIASMQFDYTNKKITIDIDETKPSTYSSAPIQGVPYVALTGSSFKQAEKFVTPNSGRVINGNTMKDFSTNTAWQDGWAQYDADGNVLVYGSNFNDKTGTGAVAGRAMYNTIWPPKNLVSFNDQNGFEYTSDDVEFKYLGVKTRKDAGTSNSAANSDTQQYAVYEIPYIWMKGRYKIWTGWGGQMDRDYQSDCTAQESDWRSHYNWGCGEWSDDNSVEIDTDTFYALNGKEGNSAGGNFNFDKVYYFSKVQFWYNLSDPHGTEKSYFIAYLANGDPMVDIERTGKQEVTGTYSIYAPNSEGRGIESWSVTLYKEDGDEDIAIKTISGGETTSNELSGTMVVDNLEPGSYYYKITVSYPASGDIAAETLSGESPHVRIFSVVLPDNVTMEQVTETGDNGETLYSFDLEINAGAPSSLIGETTDGTTPVLSLAKYYIVTLPKHASGLFSSVSGATELTSAYGSSISYNFTKNHYFAVAPDASNNYAMPTITLKNVIPGNYTAKVDMVASDGDEKAWEVYNVATATASVEMVKPAAKFEASEFKIAKCSPEATATMEDAYKVLGSNRMNMAYSNSNKISTTDGTFTPLMVTDGVLNDWNITYTVTVEENTTHVYEVVFTDEENTTIKELNAEEGVTANFDYLPINHTNDPFTLSPSNLFSDVTVYSRVLDAMTIKTNTKVSYSRKSDNTTPVYSNLVDGDNSFTMNQDNIVNASSMEAYKVKDGKDANENKTTGQYNYLVQGSYNFEDEVYGSKYGTTTYFTNAIASFQWDVNEDLHNATGFHSVSSHSGCTESTLQEGYTVIKDSGIGYERVEFPEEGGDVLRESKNPSDFYLDYSDNESVAEAVAAAGKLPIKVWHVGDGNSEPASILYTVLTSNYPVYIKPTLIAEPNTLLAKASEKIEVETSNDAKMISLCYPQMLSQDMSGTTTDINDIAADVAGDFRIWPNPAVDVVNVAASAALGTIEIYAVDGRLVKTVEVDDTHAALEVSDLVKGTYIVRAAGASQRMIKK